MQSDLPAENQAPVYVDRLIVRAVAKGASDIHVEPIQTPEQVSAVEVRFRLDGILERVELLPSDLGRSVILRLMVMAQLLTYRLDIPQEGRIRTSIDGHNENGSRAIDLRLAIIPVVHGLRAVVRLPAELTQPRALRDLGLPAHCLAALERFGRNDAGMLLVTGPAGSGKTTTIYALLEHIARLAPGTSIISLEDPIERVIPGISQIEVTPHGQLTYERALKSILRQDPQVLMLGEIRDAATASLAVQAALSGHRLIATLHAGDPATALTRLLEMGLEPYQITSSVFGVLTQRLLRRAVPRKVLEYKGRIPVAEFGELTEEVRKAILARADASALRKVFLHQTGHVTLQAVADDLVKAGLTDAAEIQRVLGIGNAPA